VSDMIYCDAANHVEDGDQMLRAAAVAKNTLPYVPLTRGQAGRAAVSK
jgi:hypothetical protein